ncbi:hypothetical protein A3K34_01645 [candidate division WWE3 bacterium RIFOXYC1_FULL_40_10]|uniref:Uncharacterized protein n=1 Tax=candidate division WWE3 bacterium RIFOXYA2_FULL_46_9 TaxID=1802636 RepID=A0A1F4W2N5_UNCKA|nr:MAG: hypothetical protein A3K58_01645 [candidate division WWE3 bacterium RIFOXYB1_FULL_40_22]OGC61569.1 MAG: hypothetical protein A3K37_01645 [candidate division WWE3 bacterium RIFOXYA1_FULL_40_11]OGC63615.1 MAG: hypothetical protein A2264_04585 [candidate division WWE3 bacterium RIFOXYA2_FULL_46_9]OGC64752.1 MAG: hypothetical protein A2326_01810 [candidate division WWE3 bacterium RIFOXYB2_FULL_41_6]OGC65952.1 MAG: hypothetical protein A3K34_01645 [candidate division WWE3 bacterium RIFOXYC1_
MRKIRISLKPWVAPETGEVLEAKDILLYLDPKAHKLMLAFSLYWKGKLIGDANGPIFDLWVDEGIEKIDAELSISGIDFHSQLPMALVLLGEITHRPFYWSRFTLSNCIGRGELVGVKPEDYEIAGGK